MTKEKLKIVFVGMPDMALVCLSRLLEENFNIVAAEDESAIVVLFSIKTIKNAPMAKITI